MSGLVWTVGHSTRSEADFIRLLQTYQLEAVADVRRLPGSRRLPQFDQEPLAAHLDRHGIAYRWFPGLGGRRKADADSPNLGWRNVSFRGYADHLQSEEFATAFAQLLELAAEARITLMCSEAVWWRCHRRLIADVLDLRGIAVVHILDESHSSRHVRTPFARLVDGRLIYPAPQ
jgi:uncharacterized protein (DUF488 family)